MEEFLKAVFSIRSVTKTKGNRYQATTGKDIEVFMCSAVQRLVECVDPGNGYSYL
jgi:hypothetical protein